MGSHSDRQYCYILICVDISILSCRNGKYYKTIDRIDSRVVISRPRRLFFFIFDSVYKKIFYYFYVDTRTNFWTIKRIIIIRTGQRTGTKFCSYIILHMVELCRTYSKRPASRLAAILYYTIHLYPYVHNILFSPYKLLRISKRVYII